MPTTSKIVASPLNARFKDKVPRMLPAPLAPFRTREGDIIDPMKVATAGYGLGGIEPEVHKLNMVVESVWLSMVGATEPQAFERILPSWEEVVKPGPGWPMLNSIPRGTSAGFPYCLDHTGGKSDFFGKDEDYSFGSVAYKKLMDDVTYMENCMRKGLRPLNVCMSFLKDERRPLDRVKAGKTRLISSSNIAFSMILRKYTMGFKHFIARGRINNGIAIGTNPYSREWEQIATLHGETKDGSLVSSVAGDFGGFDKKMVVILFQKFGDLLDKFYGTGDHESAVVRRVIVEELSYSHHVVGSQIIQWFGSNTSGNAVTIEVNSVVNLIKGRMVVAERYCKFNSVRFSQDVVNRLFVGSDKLFADTVFGDDGMMTRLSKLKSLSWFGQKQMTEDFDMIFGDEYTNESKGKSDTDNLRSMRDCTFLKRGFKFCASVAEKRNYWLAPLDINTIYGSVMWTKKDDDDFVHWRENVRGMIIECSAHETEVFNGFVDDVRKGLEGQDALLGMIFGGLTRQEDWQEILLARDERL